MAEYLSDTLERQLLHTRQVICTGYSRSDGLFEFEGRLLDSKSYDASLPYKEVPAGTPVHRMRIVMLVGRDLVIRDIEAVTEAAPTPFCTQINAAYAGIKGLRIGPGFRRRVAERVGGEQGCTHLTELLGPMATTVYQTLAPLFYDEDRQRAADEPGYVPAVPRWVVGTCHAYRADDEIVRSRQLVRSSSSETSPVSPNS